MKKKFLIILSILIIILFGVLLSYKLYCKYLQFKNDIIHSTVLEVKSFNEPFESYDIPGITYSKDDVYTVINMVYMNNIGKSNVTYQYITIPDIAIQFHDQTYKINSNHDVEKLKAEIKNEATYSFYIYYDENTGLISKIEIFCNN